VVDTPEQWLFHGHFLHHTMNAEMRGPDGSPVGMARMINMTPEA